MISHAEVSTSHGSTAVLIDSISFLTADDDGRIVVCASHGGASSGEYAAQHRPNLVLFNDAGVGKDNAGIEALHVLNKKGQAACAVSHDSARIGDVADTWEHGALSYVNDTASCCLSPGMTVIDAVDIWTQN